MSYTYDRRTSPREQNKKERLPAAEPGLRLNVMSPGQAAAPTGGEAPGTWRRRCRSE